MIYKLFFQYKILIVNKSFNKLSINNMTQSDVVPQRDSEIDQSFFDQIRDERRLASSSLNSKVSVISSDEFNSLIYQRRNALTENESQSIPEELNLNLVACD